MLGGDGGFATARWREPASSDRLPSHRSESPTGYSSAGCSPAEPASASPVTDNSSSIPIPRGNQMRRSTSLQACRQAFACDALSRWSCPPPTGCHLYFARRVTFLSCADMRWHRHQRVRLSLPKLTKSTSISRVGDLYGGTLAQQPGTTALRSRR